VEDDGHQCQAEMTAKDATEVEEYYSVGNPRYQTLTHELDDTSPFGRGEHVDLFWSHGNHTHYHGLRGVYENNYCNKDYLGSSRRDSPGAITQITRKCYKQCISTLPFVLQVLTRVRQASQHYSSVAPQEAAFRTQ